MRYFLNERDLMERRSFIESFVKEIVVGPDQVNMRHTTPMPVDNRIAGMDAEELAMPTQALSTDKRATAEGRRWER